MMKLAVPQSRDAHVARPGGHRREGGIPAARSMIVSPGAPYLHPIVQARLKIGAANNEYERAADQMARDVMRSREPLPGLDAAPSGRGIFRKTRRECDTPGSTGEMLAALPPRQAPIPSLREGGQPLTASERAFFEPRFGTDFSNVRVHADPAAARMARAIHARAFTTGTDIVFGAGQDCSGGGRRDRRLMAHELAHVVQQGAGLIPAGARGGGGPVIQRQPEQKTDDRLEAIKDKVRRGETLTEEELDYIKQRLGKEIVEQLLGGPGQIRIDYDSSRPPADINRRYRARLELRTSGLVGTVAGSLEGVAEAEVDLVATVADQKAVITIAPPEESNRMAAMIRQQLFPNGNPRSFDFKFPKKYFGWAGAISLLGPITIVLVGPGTKASGNGIVIRHDSVPAGIELIMTLAPSSRSTSVEQTERQLPGDYWTLVPNPRLFATAGYGKSAGAGSFAGTVGADFPLFYDTKNPLIYGGLGVRGSLDTNKLGRLGGTVLLGLNLDPLTLQVGLGAGAAFLPSGIQTPDGPAQTVVYYEMEGTAAYRVVSNLELMLTLTAGGAKKGPGYGTAQFGAAYRF